MRPWLAIAALLVLSACGGSMKPGAFRPLDSQNVAVYAEPVTGWPRCLEIMEDWRAALSVATLTVYHGCANISADRPPDGKKWCIVVAPPWPAEVLRHELKHCQGYRHG